MRYITGVPQTREQSEAQIARFARHWEERGFGLWAVEDKAIGAFIGFIGPLYQEEWSEGNHKTEMGWRLDRSPFEPVTETRPGTLGGQIPAPELGLERIISIAHPGNQAWRRVIEKVGDPPRGDQLERHGRGLVRYRPLGVKSQPTIEGRWLASTAEG